VKAAMNKTQVTAVAHTGLTVSDIDRTIAFYRDVLGFVVTDKLECHGPIYGEVTGVPGAGMVIAYVRAPGHTLELLQYTSPEERHRVEARPCDPGALHLAFRVKDIDTVLETIRIAGMEPVARRVPTFPPGHRSAGLRAIYTRDPDGIVVEFVEDPRIAD